MKLLDEDKKIGVAFFIDENTNAIFIKEFAFQPKNTSHLFKHAKYQEEG